MGEFYREKNSKSIGILSDVGNTRDVNEDYVGFFSNEEISMYIVADGMGGHNAGDVASKIAVESCIEYIKNLGDLNNLEEEFRNAICYANKVVYETSISSNNLNGMGTTITACLIKDNNAIIANVGDSSCYIIKDNSIKKITKDHSLVQELVDDGSISEEEALKHPNKNIITRALGTKENVEVDIYAIELDTKIKFLLCTDGLTNEISKEEIYDIIINNDNEDASKYLVERSKEKGGRDNISVIVFEGECKNDRYYSRK
ncbi:serine/threonine phosphatase stp [Clostridium homopropionicum DSM 5847]|uniref:protein-serine/threonine phosphatase n=1 Tax=Clostridium homopropionicum DSM 5847 TaxID=1121318 RepID=A0A0L6ZC44_9CLOT|nr:Stp1/IreP family PP2C-type Ser/Thr phosphatase [Clostridium homopropionicum]KOA20527.1 serine/threonine phosphatase stp [Clostridium homopropionicum DSM 5847]SFG37735.1 protein phosphatase [Clostridium homopropionicum]